MQQRVKDILLKVKAGHPLWVAGDSSYKDRLEKAFDPYFDELEELGVARHFAQAILFFGKEFVDSLGADLMAKKKDNLIRVEDIELIFGNKARDLTDKELRELKLAKNNNALIYQSLNIGGGKVRINILEYCILNEKKQQNLI